MSELSTLSIRPAIADDRDFIRSGWSTSLRGSRDIPLVPMRMYAAIFKPVFEQHIACSRILVGHGETGVLFGFIAYDPTTYVAELAGGRRRVTLAGYVLYVYVAEPFRRHKVARRLFTATGIAPESRFGYACRTRWTGKLRSKIPLAEYDSFRARYEESYVQRTANADEAATAEQRAAGDADEGRAHPHPDQQALVR